MNDAIRLNPLGGAEPYDCPVCHHDYSDAGNYLVRAIDMRTAPSFKRAE